MKVLTYVVLTVLFVSCLYRNDSGYNPDNKLILPVTFLHIEDGEMLELKLDSILHLASPSLLIAPIWGDCYVCMKKFSEWENLRRARGWEDVSMVYIVATEHPEYFLRVYYPEVSHSGLLLIDSGNAFYDLNGLQQEAAHQNTFLVDSALRVMLRGDPLLVPSLQEKYTEVIEKFRER